MLYNLLTNKVRHGVLLALALAGTEQTLAADAGQNNSAEAAQAVSGDYADHPAAKKFIEKMVTEHKFDEAQLKKMLNQAQKKQPILDAIARPAEKTKPWFEYREIFLDQKRIQQGVEFWNENEKILNEASERYGVDPAIIVAIIGVETRYGSFMGNYRVLDALTTLGFDYPPRATFFAGELEHFFLLAREQNQDPLALTGSYAGAMGFGQFIPSSYRSYARDNDGDGFADIWKNKSDAIGSVANYFKAHGWQSGQPVMAPAQLAEGFDTKLLNTAAKPSRSLKELKKLGFTVKGSHDGKGGIDRKLLAEPLHYEGKDGPDYWAGFNNFYVITRYNRSRMYARAVWELSNAIKDARTKAAGTASQEQGNS